MKIVEFLRSNFQKFCDETTTHGFYELYHAKSVIWKSIWFLVVTISLGLSVYQIQQTILAAIEQPTSTLVEKFDGDQQYPSLYICYPFWLYVVDWDKAIKTGFDRDSVVYGMSSLGTVFLDTSYNLTLAKFKFENAMERNGFKKFTWEFFTAVSFTTPPGFRSPIIHWTPLILLQWNIFCYSASSDAVREGLMTNANVQNQRTVAMDFDFSYFTLNTNFITPSEYNSNLLTVLQKAYIAVIRNPKSVINENFTVKPLLSFNGVNADCHQISEDVLDVAIVMTSKVYGWRSTNTKPCTNEETYFTYENCQPFCWWKEYMEQFPERCVDTSVLGPFEQNLTSNICIYGVQTPLELVGNDSPPDMNFCAESSSTYQSCIAQRCVAPCKQWVHHSSVYPATVPSSLARNLIFNQTIRIFYPSPDTVFSMTEIASQTWQTLIGNIGGIMGLWLGASVMSALQMIYLLCCSACDETFVASINCRTVPKKNKVQLETSSVNLVTRV